jgi:cation transport ATPase
MIWTSDATSIHRDILYSIESRSEHPLAEAVVAAMKGDASLLNDVSVEHQSGKGIEGVYGAVSDILLGVLRIFGRNTSSYLPICNRESMRNLLLPIPFLFLLRPKKRFA